MTIDFSTWNVIVFVSIRIEALWHTTSQFYTNMTVEVSLPVYLWFAVKTFILLYLTYLVTVTTKLFLIVLQFLPVYNPSQEERNDPNLYADNVQKLMAK